MKSQLDLTPFGVGVPKMGGNFMPWLRKHVEESMITLGKSKFVTLQRVKCDA